MCAARTEAGVSCWFMVSSEVGSTPCAMTIFPAGAATARTGATTTSVREMRRTAASAASVCQTIGWPAMRSYCLGPCVPARLPVPAQGTRA